jgi:hypothetical protein
MIRQKAGEQYCRDALTRIKSHSTGKSSLFECCYHSVIHYFLRYIEYKEEDSERPPSDGSKVISMALFGNNPNYTMGAIRNAQLLPVVFPGWTLRVYIAEPESANASLKVPARIISKLRVLGAQIAYVNGPLLQVPRQWSYLVADDPNVSSFEVPVHGSVTERRRLCSCGLKTGSLSTASADVV